MARAEAASGAGLSEKRTPGLPVTLLDKARFPFDSGRRTRDKARLGFQRATASVPGPSRRLTAGPSTCLPAGCGDY